MRICDRKGTRTPVYRRTVHAHLSQIFTTCTAQATWRGIETSLQFPCGYNTHCPTTKTLTLTLFSLTRTCGPYVYACAVTVAPGSWRPASGSWNRLCASHRTHAHCPALPDSRLNQSSQGACVSASRRKMAGRLELLEVEPPEVASEAEGSEGLRASPGQGRREGAFVPLQ